MFQDDCSADLAPAYAVQIQLEKQMTELSISSYRKELEAAKQNGLFGCTKVSTKLLSKILDDFAESIRNYLKDYSKGRAVRSTMAAELINRLNDSESVAYIAAKTIFNSLYIKTPVQSVYKAIGQALEDEFKMREFKNENLHYYTTIQEDLNKRGAKANRKKNITNNVFNKRLNFHLERWSVTEKVQTGIVLVNLFIETTGLVEFSDFYKKGKHLKSIIPTKSLSEWIASANEKLEVMQPFFLPMLCPPKPWTSIFDGGYISPYLKRNKLIKNNDKDYLNKLKTAKMPIVYEAINHLQNTPWQINKKVLDVVKSLWEEGRAIAELPDREDEPLIPYPYPDKLKGEVLSEDEIEIVKKWKQDTYLIHKRNIQKRSLRILTSQILRIAEEFSQCNRIWFPHQMDFRGRLYPIPVLLQPQGSDLSKGLLHFAEGKKVDENAVKWLMIHGANVYGYDKEDYTARINWVKDREDIIRASARDPLQNRFWAEADKPFQFLAFCFEYNQYLDSPDDFLTHIPIQLDGTCNGLQHYSALLSDKNSGSVVNLINSSKPTDIYSKVAEKLEEKLNDINNDKLFSCGPNRVPCRIVSISTTHSLGEIKNEHRNEIYDNCHHSNDNNTGHISADRYSCCAFGVSSSVLAARWLNLGINRKLTKRPVMVLPYGGTILSCRQYIEEYLKDNFSPGFLFEHFKIGNNPVDCIFKISVWLSKYLWEAIQETIKAAIIGMDYLKAVAKLQGKTKKPLEWITPVGLLVSQAYKSRKKKEIKTELYGKCLKTTINTDLETLEQRKQLNGVCPNFIHSLDAACLMLYLVKCKEKNITSFMTVHDCYGTLAPDTETSAKVLREAFVEVYKQPVLENFTQDALAEVKVPDGDMPKLPEKGELDIEEVLGSAYFFN